MRVLASALMSLLCGVFLSGCAQPIPPPPSALEIANAACQRAAFWTFPQNVGNPFGLSAQAAYVRDCLIGGPDYAWCLRGLSPYLPEDGPTYVFGANPRSELAHACRIAAGV